MRIRTVKPEWMEDEKLGALEDSARLLSIALILLSDDHGRGRAHPLRIAAVLWGYQRDHEAQVRKAREGLASLSRAGYIELYEVRGQSYYLISNWNKHQRVDKPSKPRHPGPDEADPKPPPPRLTSGEPSRDPRETLAPDPDPDPDPDQDPDPDPRPSRGRARAREAPREPPLQEPDRDPDPPVGRSSPEPNLSTASGRWRHFELAWCNRFGGVGMGGFTPKLSLEVDRFQHLTAEQWVSEVAAYLDAAELKRDAEGWFPQDPWTQMRKHMGQWQVQLEARRSAAAKKAKREAAEADRNGRGRRVLDDERPKPKLAKPVLSPELKAEIEAAQREVAEIRGKAKS